jgi:hypothetical protein
MSDKDVNKSPVESDDSSVAFDPNEREIVLEQKPGEQPVTIAGGSLGPSVEPDESGDVTAAKPN